MALSLRLPLVPTSPSLPAERALVLVMEYVLEGPAQQHVADRCLSVVLDETDAGGRDVCKQELGIDPMRHFSLRRDLAKIIKASTPHNSRRQRSTR